MTAAVNTVCFRTRALASPWSLDTYRSVGGYTVLARVLSEQVPPDTLLEELKRSALRGRGGAGFPTGLKCSFLARTQGDTKYLVCNSDESEPGTFKDRDILRYNPHQVIEGMLLVAYITGARVGYNYMRCEFYEPFERMEQAVQEAQAAGWLGERIGVQDFAFTLHNVLGAGAYICGEETALLESLEGKKGMPRFKPPYPAQVGLYGCPTQISNTESYASVPVILQHGGDWFLKQGVPQSGGCKIFSVSGHVTRPGNYEVPLGTPFSELLRMAGGVWNNRRLKAVIPGGSSVPVLPAATMMNVTMDYDALSQAGSMLGSGAVIVMDETTCMVKVLSRIARFYYEESCGQCTPCREGTGWLARVLGRIERGQGTLNDLQRLYDVADGIMGNTICALGDAAAMPVQSFLTHFRDEFERYVVRKTCQVSH